MDDILSAAEEILGPAVRLERHRDWAIFWCPFHSDEDRAGKGGQPNFGVHLVEGYWKCLRCGASGGSLNASRLKLGQEGKPPVSAAPPTRAPKPPSPPAGNAGRCALPFKEQLHMFQNQFRKFSAWAGILAPIIFVGVFTVEGILRSEYDPMSMYISALSLGARGWIQIANFLVLGLLLFVFTLGLSKEFQTGKASHGGIITLYVISVLFFISGPFVMDPAETPADQMSVHGFIHGISGGIVFLLMPIIIFIFLRRFISDIKWQSFRWWTLILGIIEALGVIAFTYVSKIPVEQNAYVNLLGLFQRIALIPFMVWVFIFGIETLRKQK